MKLYNILETILKSDSTYLKLIDNQGDLMLNKIHDLIDKTDENLIELLLENQELREKFFFKIKNVYVFKTNDFKFFLDENKIDNTYTQYENRIGLTAGGKFLKDSSDVVLDFPYKDCILEGGQSTEEGTDTYFEYDTNDNHYQEKQAKRKEIFFNTILAKDEIDRLLEPKAFANAKSYTIDNEEKTASFERDENGTIKDNLIIKGNNLLALHSLKSEFAGKVKLIYIDPPYNTGNDSFAYNDNFNHSTWLTFMRNRLMIAKELLKDDGVIFIHCDDNEQAYLKILCDGIFDNNFVNDIIFKTENPNGVKTAHANKTILKSKEHILVYFNKSVSFIPQYKALDIYDKYYDMYIEGDLNNLENCTVIKLSKKVKSENLTFDLTNKKSHEFLIANANRIFSSLFDKRKVCQNKDLYPESEKIYPPNAENRYFVYKNRICLFLSNKIKNIFGNERISILLGDVWDDISINNLYLEGSTSFNSGKKSEFMINRILNMTTNESDIVLDYHLGSGTTAAVAHKMNRQYIGIEQLDYGENDSVVRLRNVINNDQTGISKSVNWQGGGSFVYLELAKNNQNAIEYIQSCESHEALVAFFDEMCNKYFLHYNVKVKEFREVICKEENFKKLTLDQQKIMFAKMLDLNQLYVNFSDMKDSRFGLSENDISTTKDFYQI